MSESNKLLNKPTQTINIEKNQTIILTNPSKENAPNGFDKRDKKRGNWTTKTEFLLTSLGYAIGLGNIWRFPYLCYRNGGGAFLIPYFLTLLTCGIPLYLLEMGIGQFSSLGCVGVYRMAPLLKGTGYAVLVMNFFCACYCSVLISYPISFIMKLFTSPLPWTTCDNVWNTINCVESGELGKRNFLNDSALKTSADEFFHNEILHMSTGIEHLGGIIWPLFACLVIAWLVMYFCISRGIKSIGKVVYVTATFPFIVLIALFIRGVTLPGAEVGILYYLKPDWSRLRDIKVWSDAAKQIFFSLGPGWGSIINMASFNNFRNNIKTDALLIPIINCSTSIFAGFVVFSVLGYLSHETGLPIESVATHGPGLVFVTYPQAISMLPWPHLWAVLFFLMIFCLGLGTVFAQIDTMAACILDEIPKLRKCRFIVPLILCFAMFLVSISMVTNGGIYVLNLFDWYSGSLPVMLVCIIEVIMVSWIYGIKNFANDLFFMIGSRPSVLYTFCLKYVTPFVLTALFLASITFNGRITFNGIEYPNWAVTIGWLTCGISIIFIPLYMIYALFFKPKTIVENFKSLVKAKNWNPAGDELREEFLSFKSSLKLPQ